ncbi:hypothetical protein AVEN_273369-1 [Araneus ventricosus]|uniref:C2H2-type domain-containing protein n=1 Tax=Araneus ventricosus TaxID=182803 RepID=A0A4Y2R6K8_ARAVE|nr:hypothetical protein AVEN_242384-1 [Araneus ventricosus]GBN71301.1 hypothetical protein AVEN_273369-1 [Araneus ventricosus]
MRLMEVIARLNGGVATPTSWSTDTPDEQSMSPTSCATFSDADADLSFTIGVTENTPYACHYCDKAFPRQSYLKRHEQKNIVTSFPGRIFFDLMSGPEGSRLETQFHGRTSVLADLAPVESVGA